MKSDKISPGIFNLYTRALKNNAKLIPRARVSEFGRIMIIIEQIRNIPNIEGVILEPVKGIK